MFDAVANAAQDDARAGRSGEETLAARSVMPIVATAALALALGWAGAATMPLTDPDEGRYAEIAREMALGGDWVIPHLFEIPYLEKPPLLYWLTASSFLLFGISEQAARAVPLVASSLGVLLAGLFARSMFSARAGMLSSVVLALSGLYLVLGRTLLVDTLFAVTLAAALFSYACFREAGSRPLHALGFWVALGLAVLSKGPAAVVIAGAVIGLDLLGARSWRPLRRPAFLLSAPGFFVVALPWFVVVHMREPTFLPFYIWKEHLNRIAGAEHPQSPLFFVPALLIGLLPWTLIAAALVPAGRAETRRRGAVERDRLRFLLAWAAVVFALFSLSRGKLITYILPMFPPLAVWIGLAFDRAIDRGKTGRAASAAFAATGVVFGASAVALVVALFRFEIGLGAVMVSGPIAALTAGAVTLVAWRNQRFARPLGALVAATSALVVTLTAAAPSLSRSFTAKPLIERLDRELGPEDRYSMWGEYLPSAAFYLERHPLMVGLRPELRYGASLLPAVPTAARDWPEFRRLTTGRRVFVLTDAKDRRVKELRFLFGKVELVERTQTAALWLRP